MASVVATEAFHWSARPNRFPEQLQNGLGPWRVQKLYYLTSLGTLPERGPVSLPPWTAEIQIGEFAETKLAAFKAHTTQNPLYELFSERVMRFGGRELFHLAATSEPGEMTHETDLFAGVVDESH
jgi:LmbE family N-acetylglucosaminyl deacetylase